MGEELSVGGECTFLGGGVVVGGCLVVGCVEGLKGIIGLREEDDLLKDGCSIAGDARNW